MSRANKESGTNKKERPKTFKSPSLPVIPPLVFGSLRLVIKTKIPQPMGSINMVYENYIWWIFYGKCI